MHTATIWRIATDAAGRWAVTASEDKTARVWEVATGRQVAVLRPPQGDGHEGKLYAVALSPDGALVALGGWTGYEWDGQHSIYLFDRADGRLLRRLTGLPNVVLRLAFSADGRRLAAALFGKNGVRLFDPASGTETGRDTDYGDSSYSVDFSPDGRRLVTTSLDGQVRLYAVADDRLGSPKSVRPGGGKNPYAARFSPNGRLIALGFKDCTAVQVLDGETLGEVARPDTAGVDNGNLSKTAWSADGRYLLAGGLWDRKGKGTVRRWSVGQWSSHRDLLLTGNILMDLAPLPGGGFLFATFDPAWGVIGPDLRVSRRVDAATADLRGQDDSLGLSADARRVRFGYGYGGKDPRSFDLAGPALGPGAPSLAPARTSAPGLKVLGWKGGTSPSLDGRALTLDPYERSRSLTIAPDGQSFVLGTEWSLRRFDRTGTQVWEQPVPGAAWAVDWSPDGRFIVAAYAGGTIRWHRAGDRTLLAAIPAAKTVVLLDTCSAGGFGALAGRGIGDKDALDRLSRLSGRALIAATGDERMAAEGEGGHGAFTYALLAGLKGAADSHRDGGVEVRELADYVEAELPRITRKRGFEQYPFSATEGQSFTLLPRP